MNKTIFGGTLICTLFLLAGTYVFPGSLVMSLASTSVFYTIFRIILAVVLLVVLITVPPRKLFVRIAMAIAAVGLGSFGVYLSLSSGMHMLDAVLCLASGVAFAIESLELNEDEIQQQILRLQSNYHQQPSR